MIKIYKYIILGAGPSGLGLAHSLVDQGCSLSDILVIEKEDQAGGLCRSEVVDGAPVDIGGGHFLDIKKKDVLDLIFRFLPKSEWNYFSRIAKIRLHNEEIDHPMESNLWQLSLDLQLDYLESIAIAGNVRGTPMPNSFADYIRWKLGDRIANEYMIPYNKKMWSVDLAELGTYWLHKLPNVSFRDTLKSCIEGSSQGSLPAHGTFLYPKKFGYGEVWRRMGDSLGDSLMTGCVVSSIDLSTMTINGSLRAEKIISTIPWTLWPKFCSMDKEVISAIKTLQHASIDVDYCSDTIASEAHWIYEPSEKIDYHRILARSNFSVGSHGHWTETNSARSSNHLSSTNRFHNEFAYPINTVNKPNALRVIDRWAIENKVIPLGRWGKWEHMNSDVAVSEAISLAKEIMDGKM
jgi:protoporphyrinogen oxidase